MGDQEFPRKVAPVDWTA